MYEVAQNIREIVAKTLPILRAMPMYRVSDKPLPEKWSHKEIIGHLIDSAGNNQQKFVRTMAQSHLDFVGYDQNHWVKVQRYQYQDWQVLLDIWANYNHQIAHIIERVDPSVLGNTIAIDGSEKFTLRFIMSDYSQHLLHHLKQILPDAGLESV